MRNYKSYNLLSYILNLLNSILNKEYKFIKYPIDKYIKLLNIK